MANIAEKLRLKRKGSTDDIEKFKRKRETLKEICLIKEREEVAFKKSIKSVRKSALFSCPKWGSKYICTYESLLNDVCTLLFDHLSSTIEQIKNHLHPEYLRFFHEKPLKMNFDGTRIWKIFFIKKILKRAEEIIIWWSKIRTIRRVWQNISGKLE